MRRDLPIRFHLPAILLAALVAWGSGAEAQTSGNVLPTLAVHDPSHGAPSESVSAHEFIDREFFGVPQSPNFDDVGFSDFGPTMRRPRVCVVRNETSPAFWYEFHGEMLPVRAIKYAVHRSTRDAHLVRQRLGCDGLDTESFSRVNDLRVGQYGIVAPLSLRLSRLGVSVCRVFRPRSDEQMRGIAAWRVVAAVTRTLDCAEFPPDRQFHREAMRDERPPPAPGGQSDLPVAMPEQRACPQPAPIGVCSRHPRPESINLRRQDIGGGDAHA